MKKILVSVFVTLLVMTTAYSASLLSIVDAAKTVNSNYKLYELSMEKTQLDYDKAMIEATNKKAELSAKSSKASGDNSTQNNLSSFYSEILNDIFDIKSKEITCQTNELTVKIAEIDANDKENLFKKGLVSENDLKDASLTLKEAKSDLEQAKEDLELSLNNYKKDTSLEWEDMDLFVPEYEALLISDD
ncbi:MAG TPA: TolC family protein, partial [Thermotogota bacterium]|nr:TolC family protein [Thermotogota bacterium]